MPAKKDDPTPGTDGRQRHLLTLQSIKRELAETIRKLKSGEYEEKQGRAIIYGCSTLAEIIKGADVETLLKRLEKRIEGQPAPGDDGDVAVN